MIKRDVRYIIRRIITAVAIAFILFFLKSNNVLAATSVSSYHYRLDYFRGYCTTTSYSSCNFDTSASYLTSFTSFGTSTNPNQIFSNNYLYNAYIIRAFYVRLDTGSSTSTDFVSGQLYTLKFTLNLAPRPDNFYSSIYRPIGQTWDGSAYVNDTVEVLTFTAVPTSDSYGTEITVSFRVTTQSRYVLFNFGLLDGLKRQRDEGINFKADASTQVSSDATVQAIIDAASSIANTIISQTTEVIQNTHDDLTDIKNLLSQIKNITYQAVVTSDMPTWKSSMESGAASGGSGMSGLVGLPITFINAYIDGFNGSCQSVSFGSLYGTNLYLPCIDPSDTLGPIWNIIDLMFSIFMVYNISRRFVQMFNKFTNLETDQVDDLYGGGV